MTDPIAALGRIPSLQIPVSGLYRFEQRVPMPQLRYLTVQEDLRLDVDGYYPQMTASGLSIPEGARLWGPYRKVHWVAALTALGRNRWAGEIWYTDPPAPPDFPFTHVEISAGLALGSSGKHADVTFSGGGSPERVRAYGFVSPRFHSLALEVDVVEGVSATTSFDIASHPTRPASLPKEILTLETVYQRAGFDVTSASAAGQATVPLALASTEGATDTDTWSNDELHHAMETYWSAYRTSAQWGVWVLFATRYSYGGAFLGVMFDFTGSAQRQGAALFMNAFDGSAPADDAAPSAWLQRSIFHTVVHEVGHTLNLAHSFGKIGPLSLGTPWIPTMNDPGALSFMNYARKYDDGNGAMGQEAYYQRFDQRFSNDELLFMRHAPDRFVEPGYVASGESHAYEDSPGTPGAPLTLELRANRAAPIFEFLEPVWLELKLTNRSALPQSIPDGILLDRQRLDIAIRREGGPIQRQRPYARPCMVERQTKLSPGDSVYSAVFVGAGAQGWHIAEPGYYAVQAALDLHGATVFSNRLRLRVAPARSYDEQYLAQDFFRDDVGRVLDFGGSAFLSGANDVLRQVTEILPDRRVARHAHDALGSIAARPRKQLQLPGGSLTTSAARGGGRITMSRADPAAARRHLDRALLENADAAAETFGHILYRRRVEDLAAYFAKRREPARAAAALEVLYQTLSRRGVPANVLREIKSEAPG